MGYPGHAGRGPDSTLLEGCGIARTTSFGDLLRTLRRGASLSQEELAQRAGLSVKAIGALERGERLRPYPNTVRALALGLGLSDEDRTLLLSHVPRRHSLGGSAAARRVRAARPRSDGMQVGDRQTAAWELYVELVTRVAVNELPSGDGLLREALGSLHSLFQTTRDILRRHGPAVARPTGPDGLAVGSLALAVLNDVLRPVLAEWHPLLLDHESRRPDGVAAAEHERAWSRNEELREVLAGVRLRLDDHAKMLATAAGVRHPLVLAQAERAARL